MDTELNVFMKSSRWLCLTWSWWSKTNSCWTGPILLLEGVFSPQDLVCSINSVSPFIVKRKLSGASLSSSIWCLPKNEQWYVGFKPQHYVQAWERLNNLCPRLRTWCIFQMQMAIVSGHWLSNYCIWRNCKRFTGSVSNSAAILRYQDQLKSPVAASCSMAARQITRPIVLGLTTDHELTQWNYFRSEPNESVGYGSNFVAEQPMGLWLAAMPMVINVFHQQVFSGLSTHSYNWPCQHGYVDLTGIESAKVGSEVVLWQVQALFYLLMMSQFHPVRWTDVCCYCPCSIY